MREAAEAPVDAPNECDDAHTPEALADVLPFPKAKSQVDGPSATPDPRLRDVIGEVLRDERTRQGRTLAAVADDAAVSLPYLSEVERGRKEVSSDLLAAIGDALDLSLVEILERFTDRLRGTGVGGSGVQMLAA